MRSALIYLRGLPNMSLTPPLDSIRKPYCFFNPHPTTLTISDESPGVALKDINEDCRILIGQVLSNGGYPKVFSGRPCPCSMFICYRYIFSWAHQVILKF